MSQTRAKKTSAIPTSLIAPCGMNCRLCRAYVRDRNACPGCRGDDCLKSKSCVSCKIKNCARVAQGKVRFCFSCENFPCAKLKHLDKRYRTRYGMSMIDNLIAIREFGIRHFIRNEKRRWACPECGEMICVHKPTCLFCEYEWR